jgi:hypothetical protein
VLLQAVTSAAAPIWAASEGMLQHTGEGMLHTQGLLPCSTAADHAMYAAQNQAKILLGKHKQQPAMGST